MVGCGALGTVAAEILVRAGVGRLRLIDRDVVEWTNLQRQGLFEERDAEAGSAKAQAAAERLARINSEVSLKPIAVDLDTDNIRAVLDDADLVIDAVDNFATRLLINDWSLASESPWVHGGCVGASGQVQLFTGLGDPCFRCFVAEPPASVATCDTAGVVGAATHVIASLQACEALKWLSGNRSNVRGAMFGLDLWRNRTRVVRPDPSRECPACQGGSLEFLNGTRASEAVTELCGRDAIQIGGPPRQTLDLDRIAAQWRGSGDVETTPFFIRLRLQDRTLTLFRDGRAVIEGAGNVGKAKALYAQYVGG